MMKNYLKPLIKRLITDEEVTRALSATNTDAELYKELLRYVSYDKLADEFSHFYGTDIIRLEEEVIEPSVVETFDVEALKKLNILPYKYEADSKTYTFVINDILDNKLRKNIVSSTRRDGASAKFVYAPLQHIHDKYEELENRSKQQRSKPSAQIVSEEQAVESTDDFNAQDWVNNVLNKAIDIGASDIHIEQLEHHLQVRYRVDGIMSHKSVYNYSSQIISHINVRIKVLSSMDMSERRKPQDGRIDNYEYNNDKYDLRVSTVTTIHGEKFVMRIFDKTDDTATFDQIGFSDEDTKKIERILGHKNGIVYVGGATGSGKTTTLYTMVDKVNRDTINTYTIENPVEKSIDDVNQIQIDPLAGVTYASTLRALLRQDPDVIVVGEIRDAETAELSVQASLTGHLVLSTIHSNSALDSINRLINIGVEPYLIIASSLGFLSQRLVRTLCEECKEKITEFRPHEEAWIHKMEEDWDVTIDRSNLHRAGDGCENCTNGYRGRIAIVEVLEMSDSLGELISEGASINAMREHAISEGFQPLALNGIEKLERGITTIDELMREMT